VHSSRNIIRMVKSRKIRWTRHVAGLEIINTYRYKILVGKRGGQRLIRRRRRRCEDNIQIDKETGC
jgi:hypothetical protein